MIAGAPGLQQIGDVRVQKEIMTPLAGFPAAFRLYQREGEQGGQNDLLPEWSQFMNANEMIMKRSTIAKTFTLEAVTALALGLAPTAKADDKGCSTATLKGTFAFKATGFITAPAAAAGPLAEVGAQTFDGNGAASAIAALSQNGDIFKVTITGTYTVNPDCTGTLSIQAFPGGLKSQLFFVIDDTGNELLLICTDPGVVLTGIAKRQFARGDPRQ